MGSRSEPRAAAHDTGRGVFVTATDTGVGKSVLAASLCAALAACGARVAAFKPAVTGLDDDDPAPFGQDHHLLARVASAGQSAADVAPYRFGAAASPHYAAELEGRQISADTLLARAREAAAIGDSLIVEGVGGLLVPLAADYLVRDFAVDMGLPVVVAARPGLGTINHTLLTVAAARSVGLTVARIVLTPWPDAPGQIERSNRETLATLSEVAVEALPLVTSFEASNLAAAGRRLSLTRWIESPGGRT